MSHPLLTEIPTNVPSLLEPALARLAHTLANARTCTSVIMVELDDLRHFSLLKMISPADLDALRAVMRRRIVCRPIRSCSAKAIPVMRCY